MLKTAVESADFADDTDCEGLLNARFTTFRVNQKLLLKPQSKPVLCGNLRHLRIR